jgi:hypothetical protein
MRYRLWHAADSLVHILWPGPGGRRPRWAQWICDRHDALIWAQF